MKIHTRFPNKHLAFCLMSVLLQTTACEQLNEAASSRPLRKPANAPESPISFSARYIAAISDADMLASSYIDDQLGDKQPADAEDSLLVLRPPLTPGKMQVNRLAVSNAVTGPVGAIVASQDGEFVYTIETNKPSRVNNATTLNGLAPGTRLDVIRMSNPSQPALIDTDESLFLPQSVDVNLAGDMLVITDIDPQTGGRLNFIPVQNGSLGQKQTFSFAVLGVTPDPAVPRAAGLLSFFAAWHPSGKYVAVNFQDRGNLEDKGEVRFYRVERAGAAITALTPYGNVVETGKYPFSGRWSPNGRFYLTNDLKWGFDVPGFALTDRLSTISVIRFDEPASGQPQHTRLALIETGEASEGIAISPDGSLVATVNMRGTSLPASFPLFTRNSTVSLLTFNQQTGALTEVDEQPIEGGILPEGISFDANGNNLVISTFDYFLPDSNTERLGQGGLDFFRVRRSGISWRLQPEGRVLVARGAHGVVIAR